MTLDGVLSWLEHGDTRYVRDALINLTESDRKALGPKARGWLTRGNPTRIPATHAALAVLATADGSRQAMIAGQHSFEYSRSFVEHAAAILQARDPAWLPAFVDAVLDLADNGNWRLARGLVRSGAVAAPEHPDYVRGIVRGVPTYGAANRRPLIDQLEEDPGLVGEPLLRMLATEGSGRLLAYHDSFQENPVTYLPAQTPSAAATWRVTLLVFSQQGRLDRGRLLDTVLAAPLRDWATADLGWYTGMHDALQPSLDEIATRQGTYVRLLTVEHGPSVRTAQRELLRLVPDERFEPQPFLAASRATLGRTDKAAVAAQLRLLSRFAEAQPGAPIADIVQFALDHPRADVREQAAKILARLGVDVSVASERPRFVPTEPKARPPAAPVCPVETPDELAEVLLGLLEVVEPIETERAIDGLLRFAEDRPSTADLLLTRLSASQFFPGDPRVAAHVLALAWLAPRERVRDGDWPILLGHASYPGGAAAPQTFVGAIGRRLTGVAHAVRDGRHTSLAMPTRTDFSLDARSSIVGYAT
ncbi:DUF6493 family protein [Occultella kanbiaonis]|uniref:DUF6493 family protein n=1 Tax=Occultella kanbiaonis TaxID=2675754 RepID=UPI0012B6CA38|nr:DUF6493 family protein [Occultella kanbiaonis]